ncbi:MAG: type IV secretory system conjugative DNA transfer family protein [Phycisphaerales bacterium JB060]
MIIELLLWLLFFAVASFAIRTTWVVLGRIFGFYSPAHYRLFPRLPWRSFLYPAYKLFDIFRGGSSQAGRRGFESFLETAWHRMYKPGHLFVGRLYARSSGIGIRGVRLLPDFSALMPVGVESEQHVYMVAGTGSGKTTMLISMLALYPGNAFVVDPKGQMARALWRRRGKGGDGVIGMGRDVAVLDPLETIPEVESASWNPFDDLARVQTEKGDTAAVLLAEKMARVLVPDASGKGGDNAEFFRQASQNFLAGTMLHILASEPPERRRLTTLYGMVQRTTLADPASATDEQLVASLDFLVSQMDANDAFGGQVSGSTTLLKQAIQEGKIGGLLSEAQNRLKWIKSVEHIAGRSTLDLRDLKQGALTLFVCANVEDMSGTLAPWFRLLTTVAQQTFADEAIRKPRHSTLFVIDEMPSIGPVKVLENAAKVMRSYGIRLVTVTQTSNDIAKVYQEGASTFLTQSDVRIWISPGSKSDSGEADREYIAKKELGGLIDAYAVRDLIGQKSGRVLVTRESGRPLLLSTVPYFGALPVCYYSPDPEHRERAARTLTRRLCRWLFREATGRAKDAAAPAATLPVGMGARADRERLWIEGREIRLKDLGDVRIASTAFSPLTARETKRLGVSAVVSAAAAAAALLLLTMLGILGTLQLGGGMGNPLDALLTAVAVTLLVLLFALPMVAAQLAMARLWLLHQGTYSLEVEASADSQSGLTTGVKSKATFLRSSHGDLGSCLRTARRLRAMCSQRRWADEIERRGPLVRGRAGDLAVYPLDGGIRSGTQPFTARAHHRGGARLNPYAIPARLRDPAVWDLTKERLAHGEQVALPPLPMEAAECSWWNRMALPEMQCRWLVSVNEAVRRGQPLLQLGEETVVAPCDGRLTALADEIRATWKPGYSWPGMRGALLCLEPVGTLDLERAVQEAFATIIRRGEDAGGAPRGPDRYVAQRLRSAIARRLMPVTT